jgi:hypothetical protein
MRPQSAGLSRTGAAGLRSSRASGPIRENNLAPTNNKTDDLKPVACPICNETKTPATDYCTKCGAVLNLKKAYEHQQVHDLHEDVTMTLFKILVEKGLIDEAAKALHEAGLGGALNRLAQHQASRKPDENTISAPVPGRWATARRYRPSTTAAANAGQPSQLTQMCFRGTHITNNTTPATHLRRSRAGEARSH